MGGLFLNYQKHLMNTFMLGAITILKEMFGDMENMYR